MVATGSRIYVACLASYNAGTLHGQWIDADQDADDIREEIHAMLRQSPYPNVTVDCVACDDDSRAGCSCCQGTGQVPSAEEYAVHDYEMGGIKISEYEPLETVSDLAKAVEEHGEAFAVWWNNESRDDVDTDAFQDAYIGTFRSLEDWAEEFLDDTGMFDGVSDTLKTYFDFERYAEDCRLNGDIWSEDGGDGVFIFWNR